MESDDQSQTPDSRTAEERYLQTGGERPAGFGLRNVTSREGLAARLALNYFLTQIRTSTTVAKSARNFLKSCASPGDTPLGWMDLRDMTDDHWYVAKPLIDYIRRTGGFRTEDFDDGGREFYQWVFQNNTPIVSILEREAHA